jgi:putative ABC transport system permease protein
MYSFNETPWATMGYTDNSGIYRSFDFNSVDVQFLKTMGIPLVSGNNFFGNDDSAILVNESFVKEYGWKNPIGQKLPEPFNQKIRGVMKDFNVESLHTRIKPLILSTRFESISRKAETMLIHHAMQPEISVRLAPGNLTRQLEALKRHWQTVAPNQEFNYHFLDETLSRQYEKEERTASITGLASTLSIFISCIGLLGLVTLVVTRRTREIAIRKVLGSSVSGIITLISKDFLKLIALAACISFPLASLALNHWLNHFAYRITISWWVFGAAAVLVLFIALMTISVQAYSAALKNPSKNMRSE